MIITHNKPGAGIVLTFDDGPNPEHTPELLGVLKQLDVQAYFFICGKAVVAHPDLAKQIHADGHILCNHSFTHPHLTTLTAAEQRAELEQCSEAIVSITGEQPIWFRPPYFDTNDQVQALVDEMGMICVNRSISSRDTDKDVTSADVAANLQATKCADGIILCHEWSKPSRDALLLSLPALRDEFGMGPLALL